MTNSTLTLADVLTRVPVLHWHEAVAVVRGVAEILRERHEGAELFPELYHIQLSASGNVDVVGGTAGVDPVRRLGQLLQATLGDSEPPVQLRLVVAQATAPIAGFASLRELDAALAYFERPGRLAILQALYARAAQAPAKAVDEARQVSLDAIAPLPENAAASAEAVTTTRSKAKNRAQVAAVAAAAVLFAATAAIFGTREKNFSGASHHAAALATRSIDAVAQVLVNGMSFVTERVGLGRLVSADEGSSAPVASQGVPKAGAPPRRATESHAQPRSGPETPQSTPSRGPGAEASTRASRAVGAQASGARFRVETAPFAAFDLEPTTRPGALPYLADETVFVPVRRPANRAELEAMPIFASGAEGVSDPVALRPQLPRELPPNVRRSDLRLIELIISAMGTVESVKLLGPPRNVHDSMLLSAVKAWEFIPAVKDGEPVRYRKTIAIAPRN